MRAIPVLFVFCAWLPAIATAQPDLEAGRRTYEVCAGCHGFLAEGDELVNAPRLAGLPSWYLERQMRDFIGGVRGTAGDDQGQRMAVMARAALGERELQDLLAYLVTLPGKSAEPTLEGDAASGATRYAVCAACHGQKAEGNEALGAPALAGLDDWYLVRQLGLYAQGLRGYRTDDTFGQQMRAMAGTLTDPAAQRDVAAYVRSLAN
jgi:cytochrome c oxidase subunit 2